MSSFVIRHYASHSPAETFSRVWQGAQSLGRAVLGLAQREGSGSVVRPINLLTEVFVPCDRSADVTHVSIARPKKGPGLVHLTTDDGTFGVTPENALEIAAALVAAAGLSRSQRDKWWERVGHFARGFRREPVYPAL